MSQFGKEAQTVTYYRKERDGSRVKSVYVGRQNAGLSVIQCSEDQKHNFQRVLFPEGLVFDGESYRTAPPCIAFSYLQGISEEKSILASQSIPSWNQIISWLREMETMRTPAA